MTTASAAVASPRAHPSARREAGLAFAASSRRHPRRGEITTTGSSASGLYALGGVERFPDLAALPLRRHEAVELADRLVRSAGDHTGITCRFLTAAVRRAAGHGNSGRGN
jgi:hypothetical protein